MDDLSTELYDAGHPPVECAWFRTANSVAYEIVVSLLEGAAALGAATPLAGEAIKNMNEWLLPEDPRERRDLSRHVAVSVTMDAVEIWSADRSGGLGLLLVTLPKGEFRGHYHHYPERVDLTLDSKPAGRMVLTCSWTHLNDECLIVAKAAVALAIGPAH